MRAFLADYNHNASFSDPSEEVYTNIATPTQPTVVSGNFTVPIALSWR
ncbi:MAG: hypothetical protein IPN14_14400 [Bacteroidetes bacterium]|nr:hypothetical protein [Bacteroidota bacterium]